MIDQSRYRVIDLSLELVPGELKHAVALEEIDS